MAITHGMDVANVETLGRALQDRAQQFDQIAADINRLIQDVTWLGPDADRFKGEWWPEHQGTLKAISQDLNGLGQSALNNASEQRDVSERDYSGRSSGTRTSSLNTDQPNTGGGSDSTTSTTVGAGPEPSANSGDTITSGRGGAKVPSWFTPNTNPDFAYQCVDWAKQRRENLGLPVASGNGWELAANSGGTPSTPPSFGAIASYGDGGYGHVMIVEEVLGGGNAIRVSEMNTDSNWEVATADEFRSDRIFTLQPDGTWKSPHGSIHNITFAA